MVNTYFGLTIAARAVIRARSRPCGFDEGFLAEQVDSWWEGWMRQADQVLEDERLVTIVYEALLRRHPQSRTRGRWGAPAEVVLRMLPAPETARRAAVEVKTSAASGSQQRRCPAASESCCSFYTSFAPFNRPARSLIPTPGPLGTVILPSFTRIGGSNQLPYFSVPSLYS